MVDDTLLLLLLLFVTLSCPALSSQTQTVSALSASGVLVSGASGTDGAGLVFNLSAAALQSSVGLLASNATLTIKAVGWGSTR